MGYPYPYFCLCALLGPYQMTLAEAVGASTCLEHAPCFRRSMREFSKIRGTLFGGPYNKDPTI